MSRSEWFLSLALLLLFCGSASGVELNYTWKKGDIHRFNYQDVTEFDMKMGGMPGMAMMGGDEDRPDHQIHLLGESARGPTSRSI